MLFPMKSRDSTLQRSVPGYECSHPLRESTRTLHSQGPARICPEDLKGGAQAQGTSSWVMALAAFPQPLYGPSSGEEGDSQVASAALPSPRARAQA
ncbi:MAG: hypothetical protein D6793_11295 [Thermoflexia bacterium]|nr:MAG: hypothetical protein D6793_11295 [Thermoflexia bacterium]